MPLIKYHFPAIQNIKRDPFEQAVPPGGKTVMAFGGALAAPSTAYIYDALSLLSLGQELWLEQLMTYKKYPPLQDPETYNLDMIIKEVNAAHQRHRSE